MARLSFANTSAALGVALLALSSRAAHAQNDGGSTDGGGDNSGGDNSGDSAEECKYLFTRQAWMMLSRDFWQGALANFTETDFTDAGLPVWSFQETQHILEHEQIHVAALGDLINSVSECANQANVSICSYTFPQAQNVTDMLRFGRYLEFVGSAGWVGVSTEVDDDLERLLAASMAAEQQGHVGFLSTLLNMTGSANPFVQPLDSGSVGSIALQYVTEGGNCSAYPDAYPSLPQADVVFNVNDSSINIAGFNATSTGNDGGNAANATHCAYAFNFNIVLTSFDGATCLLPGDVVPPHQSYIYLVNNATSAGGAGAGGGGGDNSNSGQEDGEGDLADELASSNSTNNLVVVAGPALLELGTDFNQHNQTSTTVDNVTNDGTAQTKKNKSRRRNKHRGQQRHRQHHQQKE